MKEINYNSRGQAISDFDCEEALVKFLNSEDSNYWEVSTWLLIDCLRVMIKKDNSLLDKVKVTIGDDYLPFNIDKDGRSNDWRNAPCLLENILLELV